MSIFDSDGFDSGMLLYKIPWQVGSTFSAILDSYVNYIDSLGKEVHVIFDRLYGKQHKGSL